MTSVFQTRVPHIDGNENLRIPQREGFRAVESHYDQENAAREVGVILPVGCGKSGLITLLPFATKSLRALVIAPGLKIAEQLYSDFDPSKTPFYVRTNALRGTPLPEPVDIRGGATNRTDLDEAEVVITNIHQLQGTDNKWLTSLPSDFFDLIIFDEGHHNVAASWEQLRKSFPNARLINLSATPSRADGQVMAGQIVYSFPIADAIRLGYVKRLKGLVLNPSTLRFVRREGEAEIEVALDEVRRLGEQDADFRRSIVTSKATLTTIVDASIRELERLRKLTGEPRLKIIAAALNREHCIQVVEAYRARGRHADFVHSLEDGAANARVMKQLESHELDVIVQVRKLGEGFDHPFLSVAAIFTVFSNLSPFVQFVGRIMRVIKQNDPASTLNQGTVVFHAGSNIARHWSDLQAFSQADQQYFEQLLPMEGLDFTTGDEIAVDPAGGRPENTVDIREQAGVHIEVVPLLESDAARSAIETLAGLGVTPEQYGDALAHYPIPTSRVQERRAARAALDEEIRRRTGQLLAEAGINPQGKTLDRKFLGRPNFVVLKAAIDVKVNAIADRDTGERGEFTRDNLAEARAQLNSLSREAFEEVTNG